MEQVTSGKNDVRPTGGWAGGHHAFVSGALCKNYYTFIYETWHIFGPFGLIVPFGGHIAIAHVVFP